MDSYVGPYRILRLINRGGQGSVYLGYDKRLHRRVAIKIYDIPRQRQARNRLLREARLVASLHSPKVVQIHDVIESSKHLAMIMEYVPGCNLEEFLQRLRPSMGSILTVVTDVAGALAAARQQQIVHGDLKAGNVLITADGRAKLTDFGLSGRVGDPAASENCGASFAALSPEQYLGQPLGVNTDLFALGSLLYRMLSGEHPFYRHGQFDPDLLLQCTPVPLEDAVDGAMFLPAEIIEAVAQLLQKDPQQRPASTRPTRQAMRAVARQIPISATHSLLREARPCFRHESPEDIPPPVPGGLGKQGKSRLIPPGGRCARLRQRVRVLSVSARLAAALGVMAIVSTPLVIALQNSVTPVQFARPVISITSDQYLPSEISRAWLVREVQVALEEELGKLLVLGEVGVPPVTAIYSAGTGPDLPSRPEETFQLALRCVEEICVFTVNREHAGQRSARQGVIVSDKKLPQWTNVVRETTRSLYR